MASAGQYGLTLQILSRTYRTRIWPSLSTHVPYHLVVLHHQQVQGFPDNKVHGANMGPVLGRQDPGGPHVGPMNFAIWVTIK